MAFLGRPSAGDSPFAIGDKAMRDTSSPQPPSQRNPTPRQAPGFGSMQAPSPYGSVSDEARRRYEERYQKKKAEEAAKVQEELNKTQQQQQGPPGGYGGGHQQGGYGGPPPQQQQQYGGYNGGPPPHAGGYQQQQHQQPPPQHQRPVSQQSRPFSPPSLQGHIPPSGSSYNGRPPQQGGYQQAPPSGFQQPPPQGQGYGGHPQQHPPHGYGSPPLNQQPQSNRYSNPPLQQGGPRPGPPPHQWSQNSAPPPSQQWDKPTSPPPALQAADTGELRRMFNQFDSSRAGQLNAFDLQRLLAKDETIEAREDCVKMLMNIFDTDRSGSINFTEFEGLYRYIQDWHGIFLRFDRDNSGLIDRKELHQALLGFGFSLPSEMVRKLEKRFAPPPIPGHAPSGGISFDRFLMACVTVKHYTEAFRKADVRGEGRLTLDYNEFMGMMLDSPS